MRHKAITDEEIAEAKTVLKHHSPSPITSEAAVECLLWCISSQALSWEATSKFVYNLREASYPNLPSREARLRYASKETLYDPARVREVAQKSGLRFKDRFNEAILRFGDQEALQAFDEIGNASASYGRADLKGEWWEDIRDATSKTREQYVDEVKWVGRKTFSFWHICLGGTNLVALDVHVMRELRNNYGVKMDNGYIEGVRRNKKTKLKHHIVSTNQGSLPLDDAREDASLKTKEITQIVRLTPDKEDYLRIERAARDKFRRDSRFRTPEGNVDMALVDALLWWRGASRSTLAQQSLFGLDGLISEYMPYAKIDHL